MEDSISKIEMPFYPPEKRRTLADHMAIGLLIQPLHVLLLTRLPKGVCPTDGMSFCGKLTDSHVRCVRQALNLLIQSGAQAGHPKPEGMGDELPDGVLFAMFKQGALNSKFHSLSDEDSYLSICFEGDELVRSKIPAWTMFGAEPGQGAVPGEKALITVQCETQIVVYVTDPSQVPPLTT